MKAIEAAAFLAERKRTVLLGGMAVILHGFSRTTKDVDLWMDPGDGTDAWADTVKKLLSAQPDLVVSRIDRETSWRVITPEEINEVARNDGLIRMTGTDRPIDLFYWPNELELNDFPKVWNRATPIEHGLRLIDEIDLMVTKQQTNRTLDEADLRFLSDKVERNYQEHLKKCSLAEARVLFDRYSTPSIADFTRRHAETEDVRRLGQELLIQMRDDGDPFAAELLRDNLDPGA